MSDQRTHRRGSGRLISTSLSRFWQPPSTHDAADPSIPNLPLETAAAPPAGSAEGYPAQHRQRAYRRDTTSRRLVTLPILHLTQPAVASTDSALAEPFRTKVTRSRRQLAAGWMAGLAAQGGTPAVIPYPSWSRPVTVRRKATERRLIEAPALHWNYIAPTIAAILAKPTAKVIEFRRTIQLPQPLALYPPPTGPPTYYPAWAAIAAKRVSQDRRLQAQPAQASYPATPAPPTVEFAALVQVLARRRKSSGAGFVSVAVVAGSPNAAVVPASYPSNLPTGYNRRRDTERRHLVALIAPEFPPTTAPPASTDSALTEPFTTRRSRSRKLLVPLVTPAYTVATPPEPTPAVYPSFVVTGFHHRQPRNAGFVAVDGVTGSEPIVTVPYPSYVPQGFRKRSETERRHLSAINVPSKPQTPVPNEAFRRTGYLKRKQTRWTLRSLTLPPDTPQTPPVPEQPPTAFKLAIARYTPPQHREHIAPLLVPEWPESPPITPTTDSGGGWWPDFEHYRRRKERDRQELKRRREEAQRIADETAREIARLLHEQELKDAEAADLRRIRDLADRAQALRGSGQLSAVIERRLSLLAMETTRSALQALERELLEQIEQEEISALILILNDYETD